MADSGKRQAPYGSWESPIGAELLASATLRFEQVAIGAGSIFWSESRPAEGGRSVVVELTADGRTVDRNPPPFNARTRVHEYGGGAYALAEDGEIFFSNDADQRIYRARRGEAPVALTAAGARRFADARVDAARKRLIAVREDHGATAAGATHAEPVNAIVAIDLASGAETVLAEGHDFFSSPRLSPDGGRLAWLAWDHPRMPWQGSDLWLAELDDAGVPRTPRQIAGGTTESICQPEWSPAGELHFVSDRSGWWNLHRLRDGKLEALHPMAAEFAEPHWVFGGSKYGFLGDGTIVCVFERDGRSQLARLDADGAFTPIATPFCAIGSVRVGAGFVACLAASETRRAGGRPHRSRERRDRDAAPRERAARSTPKTSRSPSRSASPASGGAETHAFFYRPRNRAFQAPPGERPPLLVLSHGGPTGATDAGLRLSYQFWTTRGFAVVDVNYGGSAGYGRAYRERLDGRWGEVDVDDVVAAARFVVARGDADRDRVAIRGGSAGGYTTLAALTFCDYFRAGASHYGVSDLETLARDTHKFESRYLDSLIGPWPERADLYRARSPIHCADRITSPLIVFQGAEDKAVPPSQAETMVNAVRAKGLPVAYLLFAGEQHGFRRAETIRRAFEAELSFYGQIFGFVPAGAIAPVEIENLAGGARGPGVTTLADRHRPALKARLFWARSCPQRP